MIVLIVLTSAGQLNKKILSYLQAYLWKIYNAIARFYFIFKLMAMMTGSSVWRFQFSLILNKMISFLLSTAWTVIGTNINSLLPCDAILQHRCGSALAQVIAIYYFTPFHYISASFHSLNWACLCNNHAVTQLPSIHSNYHHSIPITIIPEVQLPSFCVFENCKLPQGRLFPHPRTAKVGHVIQIAVLSNCMHSIPM